MSTFRNAVNNLNGKSAYIMVGSSLVLASKINIVNNIVEVDLSAPMSGNIKKIYVHIDNLVFADDT